MIALLFLFTTVIWYIMFGYRRRRLYKLAALFPKPESELPVIGISHMLSGNMEGVMITMQNASYETMHKGGIMRAWFGPFLYFIAVDPVDVEMVLRTCLEKDYVYRFLRSGLGDGTVTAPVSIWGRRRKILSRAFKPKIVENLVKIFSEKSEKLTKLLESCIDLGKIDMWPFMSTFSFDSVFETFVGIKSNTQENQDSPILKFLDTIQEIISERFVHLWLHPDWLFSLFPQSSVFNKHMALSYEYADKVIRKIREGIKIKNIYDTNAESYTSVKLADLLITLSGCEEGYTDVELRDELLTLIVSGTDTIAVSVGFTLKLLGKYPEVQDKLYQELRNVFGDSDRPLEKEDLIKLNFLDRVVKESLRLFPPVPFIVRKVLKDTQLVSGRVLPAGSSVCVSIWGAHRDPKYWGPDAENFDPDRFLPERLNLAHACSYIPFSYGRRNCVAFQYAMMSEKTLLSAIIRRYRVVGDIETSLAPQIPVKFDIVMKAVDKYQLELEKRKHDTGDDAENKC